MKDTKRKESLAHDEKFSTTSNLTLKKPIIKNKLEDKFKTLLFLPQDDGRKGEGGLRTKGYFKQSLPNKPLVSIITVAFNGEKYLEQTIQSVLNQTYDNVEYIIIDGGSTDGTLDIINKYKDKIDYWVSEKDEGIYDAMNKGIRVAQGRLVGILNSDDKYTKKAVELASKCYIKSNFQSVCYGDLIKFHDFSNKRYLQRGKMSPRFFTTGKIKINHPTCFVPIKFYKSFGFFDIDFTTGADRELMLRFFSQGVKFFNTNKVMAMFRFGGDTSQYNLLKAARIAREEYHLRVRYYSRWISFKASVKCFWRGVRNLLLITILGKHLFITYRISRQCKKGP